MQTPVEKIRIWHKIRKLNRFECQRISESLDCSVSVVLKYAQTLHNSDFAEFVGYGKNGCNLYAIKDEYRRHLRPPLVEFDSTREKIWLTMRLFRRFTVESLETSVGTTTSSVHKFLTRLIEVGVVRVNNPPKFYDKNNGNNYLLINNLGVLPPVVCKDGRVLDSNTGEYLEVKL